MVLWLIIAPLTAALGYLYPAYQSYKAVEKRQPDIDELLYWGKYWIVVGILAAIETLFFGFLSLIPLYTSLRLLLLVYLWHPRTQGVLLIYHKGVQPTVMKHEHRIDQTLQELHTRGTDLIMEQVRNAAGVLQNTLQQGGGMVKNQYQSFSKQRGAPPPPTNAPNPYPPSTDGAGAAGGPDSMYNLRTRKGYDSQPY